MSCLTSSIVFAWSGVSSNGNASSTSRCHGVSGENAKPGAREPAAVQHHELLGDLAHCGAHTRLGLLEVGATHAVQGRRLATGVPADGVHLVGRDVELVAALVLEEQVVARDTADRALDHARVPRHTVHLVHDEVAGGQRVVEIRAAARATGLAVHPPTAGEVGLGDDRDARHPGRPHPARAARRRHRWCPAAIAPGAASTPSSASTCDEPGRPTRSPSAASTTREPSAASRRRRSASAVVSPTTGSKAVAARCGVSGPSGADEHLGRAGGGVGEHAVEREREARPRVARAPLVVAPHVVASVSASAASSSSSSCARSRMRRGSHTRTSASLGSRSGRRCSSSVSQGSHDSMPSKL